MELEDIIGGNHSRIEFEIDGSILQIDADAPAVGLSASSVKISIDGVQLEYNRDRYANATPEFLDKEIDLHQTYLEALRKYQESLITKLNMSLEKYSDLKRVSQFLPQETIAKMVRSIFPILNIPTRLTIRRNFNDWKAFRLKELRRELRRYGYFSRAAQYGHDLIQDAANSQISSTLGEKIQALAILSRDIVYMHNDVYRRKANIANQYAIDAQFIRTGIFPD